MIRLTFLAAVGCLVGLEDPASPPDPKASYDQMKASAGRDAASQVGLALWCEAHGLERERLRHLAVAVLSDPSNAMARGLMGLVEYRGKWRRPEAVADAVKADVKQADLLVEYNGRRVRTPVKPDAQYKLALWCEERGLKDEARAHLATVVRLDPRHAEAWKKLGYKKVGDRWVTEAQTAAEKTEKQLQQVSDKRWRPRLERLRAALEGKGQKQEEALRELATIADPRAVPAVWHVFVERGGNHQIEAVQLLGQIDAVEASQGLASLALFNENAEVRRRATETLRRRDPREWAHRLIALFRTRIKYEFRPVGGPGSPGVLFVEGKEANVQRFYAPPPAPFIAFGPNDSLETDAFGLPVIVRHHLTNISQSRPIGRTTPSQAEQVASEFASNPSNFMAGSPLPIPKSPDPFAGTPLANTSVSSTIKNMPFHGQDRSPVLANPNLNLWERGRVPTFVETTRQFDDQVRIPIGQMVMEAQRGAASAAQQLANDVRSIDATNASIQAANERIAKVLSEATGVNLPAEPKPWASWYGDQLGIRYKMTETGPIPTISESVPLAYVPQPVLITEVHAGTGAPTMSVQRHSCFGKGTPVRTLSGPRPIETLNIGDLVLSQDTHTGKLAYRPVVMAHHNPPSPTFEVALGGDAVVTSPSHRFWVAGRGWVMARELKTGDPIRTLGGIARVAKIETGEVQPVFNLDIEGDADFFVGEATALVHDNTLPDLKQAPFDAPPAVAAK